MDPGASSEISSGGGSKSRPFRFGPTTQILIGAPDRDPLLGPGSMVGERYRIVGFLGEGGMGRVYEAEVVGGTGTVALKVLRREGRADDQLARFKQEGKAASRVGHSSIVQVLDFAELPDGTTYLAMERLHGRSLEDWLEATGRLSDGLRWLAEISRGLHAAHQAGVVHRDIKPANLFLHSDPRSSVGQHDGQPNGRIQPKILDFGIAKVVTADVTRIETQAGMLLGTPYYLAPERALGRSLDGRADLYSLGVILYEMLTGMVPFDDTNFMGILAQHIQARPLDPRQVAPDRTLPPGVCRLTMRVLAKDPDDRPPHGLALAEELEGLLVHEAAAIEAVTIGPRAPAAAGEATVELHDIAQRPTAVPAEASTAHLGAAGGSVVGATSSGARPSSTAGRWLSWLAGAVGVALLGAAVSWIALEQRAEGPRSEPAGDAPEARAEPVAGEVEGLGAAEEPGPTPSEPEPVPSEPTPEPAVTPEPVPAEPAPTPAEPSGDRTSVESPKPSRPRRPRPKPPAPPELKDDVYD